MLTSPVWRSSQASGSHRADDPLRFATELFDEFFAFQDSGEVRSAFAIRCCPFTIRIRRSTT